MWHPPRLRRSVLLAAFVVLSSGCQFLVDFDRGRLVDAGSDAEIVDGASEALQGRSDDEDASD